MMEGGYPPAALYTALKKLPGLTFPSFQEFWNDLGEGLTGSEVQDALFDRTYDNRRGSVGNSHSNLLCLADPAEIVTTNLVVLFRAIIYLADFYRPLADEFWSFIHEDCFPAWPKCLPSRIAHAVARARANFQGYEPEPDDPAALLFDLADRFRKLDTSGVDPFVLRKVLPAKELRPTLEKKRKLLGKILQNLDDSFFDAKTSHLVHPPDVSSPSRSPSLPQKPQTPMASPHAGAPSHNLPRPPSIFPHPPPSVPRPTPKTTSYPRDRDTRDNHESQHADRGTDRYVSGFRTWSHDRERDDDFYDDTCHYSLRDSYRHRRAHSPRDGGHSLRDSDVGRDRRGERDDSPGLERNEDRFIRSSDRGRDYDVLDNSRKRKRMLEGASQSGQEVSRPDDKKPRVITDPKSHADGSDSFGCLIRDLEKVISENPDNWKNLLSSAINKAVERRAPPGCSASIQLLASGEMHTARDIEKLREEINAEKTARLADKKDLEEIRALVAVEGSTTSIDHKGLIAARAALQEELKQYELSRAKRRAEDSADFAKRNKLLDEKSATLAEQLKRWEEQVAAHDIRQTSTGTGVNRANPTTEKIQPDKLYATPEQYENITQRVARLERMLKSPTSPQFPSVQQLADKVQALVDGRTPSSSTQQVNNRASTIDGSEKELARRIMDLESARAAQNNNQIKAATRLATLEKIISHDRIAKIEKLEQLSQPLSKLASVAEPLLRLAPLVGSLQELLQLDAKDPERIDDMQRLATRLQKVEEDSGTFQKFSVEVSQNLAKLQEQSIAGGASHAEFANPTDSTVPSNNALLRTTQKVIANELKPILEGLEKNIQTKANNDYKMKKEGLLGLIRKIETHVNTQQDNFLNDVAAATKNFQDLSARAEAQLDAKLALVDHKCQELGSKDTKETANIYELCETTQKHLEILNTQNEAMASKLTTLVLRLSALESSASWCQSRTDSDKEGKPEMLGCSERDIVLERFQRLEISHSKLVEDLAALSVTIDPIQSLVEIVLPRQHELDEGLRAIREQVAELAKQQKQLLVQRAPRDPPTSLGASSQLVGSTSAESPSRNLTADITSHDAPLVRCQSAGPLATSATAEFHRSCEALMRVERQDRTRVMKKFEAWVQDMAKRIGTGETRVSDLEKRASAFEHNYQKTVTDLENRVQQRLMSLEDKCQQRLSRLEAPASEPRGVLAASSTSQEPVLADLAATEPANTSDVVDTLALVRVAPRGEVAEQMLDGQQLKIASAELAILSNKMDVIKNSVELLKERMPVQEALSETLQEIVSEKESIIIKHTITLETLSKTLREHQKKISKLEAHISA